MISGPLCRWFARAVLAALAVAGGLGIAGGGSGGMGSGAVGAVGAAVLPEVLGSVVSGCFSPSSCPWPWSGTF